MDAPSRRGVPTVQLGSGQTFPRTDIYRWVSEARPRLRDLERAVPRGLELYDTALVAILRDLSRLTQAHIDSVVTDRLGGDVAAKTIAYVHDARRALAWYFSPRTDLLRSPVARDAVTAVREVMGALRVLMLEPARRLYHDPSSRGSMVRLRLYLNQRPDTDPHGEARNILNARLGPIRQTLPSPPRPIYVPPASDAMIRAVEEAEAVASSPGGGGREERLAAQAELLRQAQTLLKDVVAIVSNSDTGPKVIIMTTYAVRASRALGSLRRLLGAVPAIHEIREPALSGTQDPAVQRGRAMQAVLLLVVALLEQRSWNPGLTQAVRKLREVLEVRATGISETQRGQLNDILRRVAPRRPPRTRPRIPVPTRPPSPVRKIPMPHELPPSRREPEILPPPRPVMKIPMPHELPPSRRRRREPDRMSDEMKTAVFLASEALQRHKTLRGQDEKMGQWERNLKRLLQTMDAGLTALRVDGYAGVRTSGGEAQLWEIFRQLPRQAVVAVAKGPRRKKDRPPELFSLPNMKSQPVLSMRERFQALLNTWIVKVWLRHWSVPDTAFFIAVVTGLHGDGQLNHPDETPYAFLRTEYVREHILKLRAYDPGTLRVLHQARPFSHPPRPGTTPAAFALEQLIEMRRQGDPAVLGAGVWTAAKMVQDYGYADPMLIAYVTAIRQLVQDRITVERGPAAELEIALDTITTLQERLLAVWRRGTGTYTTYGPRQRKRQRIKARLLRRHWRILPLMAHIFGGGDDDTFLADDLGKLALE